MKRLLIDVNSVVPYFASGKCNGIGRTTRELVMALDALEQIPFDIHLYSQNVKGIGAKSLGTKFLARHLTLPNRSWLNTALKVIPVRELLFPYDFIHCPTNYGHYYDNRKLLLTIHDALYFAYPESFLGHDQARVLYPPLARAAKSIITCSHSSKSDIVHYMGIDPDKIAVAHWGVDHTMFYPDNRDETNAQLRKAGLDHPYFIMVSCDIGRKNTETLMHAFRRYLQMPSSEHKLVLLWPSPPTHILNEFRKEIDDAKIVFLSDVSDDQLRSLYNGATASFFPSKYEGFGLPVLESMACGTPVITCRNSSLTEVGGNAAMYTDPDNTDEMATIMDDFESGKIDSVDVSNASLLHASTFRWERTARQYVEFYRKALEV